MVLRANKKGKRKNGRRSVHCAILFVCLVACSMGVHEAVSLKMSENKTVGQSSGTNRALNNPIGLLSLVIIKKSSSN